MKKYLFTALMLLAVVSDQLSVVSNQLSVVRADEVVRLEPVAGSASEYRVAELLRVELIGDSIRFIAADGTPVAEVYKYDYVQLTIGDAQQTGVESTANSQEPRGMQARKVIKDGQVYILFGDKLYNISGNKIK